MSSRRSDGYPLDVTNRFTEREQEDFFSRVNPSGRARNEMLDSQGDVRNHVIFEAVRLAYQDIYLTAAYADLIDENLLRLRRQVDRLEDAIQRVEGKIASLQQTCETLSVTTQQVASLLGVVIPAWVNRQEVEQGDEMGVARPSAAELNLIVVFETDRQVPGFSHEDVISITPPAGTFVQRGSTVTVVLNLEG